MPLNTPLKSNTTNSSSGTVVNDFNNNRNLMHSSSHDHSNAASLWIIKRALRLIIFFWLSSIPTVLSQDIAPTVIYGIVLDTKDMPIAFANVQALGTKEGASTRLDGQFDFVTEQVGLLNIQVSMLGYEPVKKQLSLVAEDSNFVKIVLQESVIDLQQLVVTSDGYSTGDSDGVTLQSLDVVTTPGAAADILLALKTFPGTSMVDEGAGLFVRGGDLSETLIILDQATLSHPYKFESPTGGIFGVIPPFMIQKTAFSTGGFSAKYGNALSSVLNMNSQNLPQQRRLTLNAGLAAASLGLDIPLIKETLGVRFTGNRSFTKTLFQINGQYDQFSETPRSSDLNLSLTYDYSSSGKLKIYNFLANDRLGVSVNLPSFVGDYRGKTSTSLSNIQWSDILNGWYIQGGFSLSQYSTRQQIGDLDMRPSDTIYKFRVDAEHYIGEVSHVRAGFEFEKTNSRFIGTFPAERDLLTPNNNYLRIDESYSATRIGSYSELLIKLTRKIALNSGIRGDYHSMSKSLVIDPRISLRYAISKTANIRFAWGIYHQFAAPFEYNSFTGNPKLEAQHSQHYILGFNHENTPLQIRVEAYYKPYYKLILQHSELNLSNDGEGRSHGIDFFMKYGAFLQTRMSGWVSYSYNRSVRTQMRSIGEEFIYERARAPFEIRHNLTVVAKYRLIYSLYGGVTMRYATGQPITPVVSSIPVNDGNYFLPVEGSVGSEQLPSFQRLDLQLSYYLPFGEKHDITFYLALGNALNRANVTGLEYSSDYSMRTERISNYRRFFYCGVSVSLNQ